eukprot:768766-Hanusia_phi.AAC.11
MGLAPSFLPTFTDPPPPRMQHLRKDATLLAQRIAHITAYLVSRNFRSRVLTRKFRCWTSLVAERRYGQLMLGIVRRLVCIERDKIMSRRGSGHGEMDRQKTAAGIRIPPCAHWSDV